MRVRSTGLGKQEMGANVENFQRNGDYVIMRVKTYEPVKWKIRVALSRQDLFALMLAMVKALPAVISCILAGSKQEKKFGDDGW
jgi:hypothetical protein